MKRLLACALYALFAGQLLTYSPLARADETDPILKNGESSAWNWEFQPGVGLSEKNCRSGSGKVVLAKDGTAASKGHVNKSEAGEKEDFETGGTWKYLQDDEISKLRVYTIEWGSGFKDTLSLSKDGSTLTGSNVQRCTVTGTRSSADK